MARHRTSGRSDRREGLNPSNSTCQPPLLRPEPTGPTLVRPVHPIDARQGQLPLIPEYVENESKGKTRRHGPDLGDPASGALTEAAFRHARTVAASTSVEERLPLARGFTFSAIAAYWKNLQARKGLGRPLPDRPPGMETACPTDGALEAARVIGTTAAGLEEKDASFLIGGLYTAAMPERVRAELGAHYTPPALCERLLDMATEAGVDWSSARVLDPACGGGGLFVGGGSTHAGRGGRR